MEITWKIKSFNELLSIELYQIFNLRIAVFILEQNSLYQDADWKDLHSFHLMGMDEKGDLVAYARILPSEISYKEVSIGRVIATKKLRGEGLGADLMERALQFISIQFGAGPIRISAQCYLIKFYSKFGFEIVGEEYLEDNLPHIEMLMA